jgi:hypothetical protein
MFAFMPLPLAIAASFDANRTVVSHGYVSAPFEAILFGAVVLAVPLSSMAVTALGAWIGGRLFGHARAFAVVRALAWVATIGAAGLLTLAAIRMRRPTALGYVASLPVVEALPPVDRPGAGEAEHAAIWIMRAPLSERAVARERNECIAWPRRTFGGVQPDRAFQHLQMAHFNGCGALQVRRDEGRGYLVLEDAAGKRLAFADAWIHSPIALSPWELTGALRPPDAFTALAALGLAAALVALLRPRRSPLGADESACRDAEALDGTLCFDDGTPPLPLPAGASPVTGPVVAVLGTPAASFREHAGPVVVRVVPGTLAQHRAAGRVGPAAFALVFVMVACTPLATALAHLR